ncbi:4-hydroxy-tetrahydrodipicolinate reductase [bacterium]|nr:4-hydroxy-tetrahydrodipicolinate reductase [bacterium]
MIPVIVNGAQGKMGQEAVKAVQTASGLELAGCFDVDNNLEVELKMHRGCVVVDFTHPSCAFQNAQTILAAGCHGVIGTTGFQPSQIDELAQACKSLQHGFFIAPNFAIGAVLMMRFAAEAARHMERAEIIELHHTGKADAPSGTAHKTAEMMAESRAAAGLPSFEGPDAVTNTLPGTRGGCLGGIRIHAVRMPGVLANQEVLLGAAGQILSIRHDTLDRSCFMPGVVLACRKVRSLKGLVVGLDQLLWNESHSTHE